MATTSMQFGQSAINVVLNEGQLPANRESQYKWMLKHHAYGDRTLPHGWKHLT